MKIVISSGHGLHIRGARGPDVIGIDGVDEVDEARKIVEEVANWLIVNGHEVITFHDDTSHDQNTNLHWLVDHHNGVGPHDLDVSIHLNAYMATSGAMGTECLFLTLEEQATKVAQAISQATGLINRGPKKRSDLYFLNKTNEPALLLECLFCDSKADIELYKKYFVEMCQAIANVATKPEDFDSDVLQARGKCSWFGGKSDTGVSPSEGLAFLYDVSDKPALFYKEQPPGTTGLARRLNSEGTHFIALRWDYDTFPKEMLAGKDVALVRAPKTGKHFTAHPADWGPHSSTDRLADVSKKLLDDLEISTDDEVEVIYPYRRHERAG